MASLKEKTISGLFWGFTGDFVGKAIAFVVGIILARLLSPKEYGLVGIVMIFVALTGPFINSGFSQALIRKKDCSQKDFSTVFYFNMAVGVVFYALLFIAAPHISNFFGEPQLTTLTRVIGLIVIIDAATLIQTTILTKEINFKTQTKVGLISAVVAGAVGIGLAVKGLGVWSLVVKMVLDQAIRSLLLWFLNRWKPLNVFSKESFKELFGFGSKLLINSFVDKIYYNIYNIVIAKYYSTRELGLFTRADMFKNLLAQTIGENVGRVSFPVLSVIQGDENSLKNNYKKLFTSTMYVNTIMMVALAAAANNIVIGLLGSQWEEAVPYLYLLPFVGIFMPIHNLTNNIFNVLGKSGMVLKLGLFTKLMALPSVLLGLLFGLKIMIAGMIASACFVFLVYAHISGKRISYPLTQQILDLRSTILIASITGAIIFFAGILFSVPPHFGLIIQIVLGGIVIFSTSEIIKPVEYLFIKEIIKERLLSYSIFRKN